MFDETTYPVHTYVCPKTLLNAATNISQQATSWRDEFVEPAAKAFVEHLHNRFQKFDQVTVDPALSKQFMAVYTEKVREEATSPTRQVMVTHCDVDRKEGAS